MISQTASGMQLLGLSRLEAMKFGHPLSSVLEYWHLFFPYKITVAFCSKSWPNNFNSSNVHILFGIQLSNFQSMSLLVSASFLSGTHSKSHHVGPEQKYSVIIATHQYFLPKNLPLSDNPRNLSHRWSMRQLNIDCVWDNASYRVP